MEREAEGDIAVGRVAATEDVHELLSDLDWRGLSELNCSRPTTDGYPSTRVRCLAKSPMLGVIALLRLVNHHHDQPACG